MTLPGLVKSVVLVNQFSREEIGLGWGWGWGWGSLDLYVQISSVDNCGVNTPTTADPRFQQVITQGIYEEQPVRSQENVGP